MSEKQVNDKIVSQFEIANLNEEVDSKITEIILKIIDKANAFEICPAKILNNCC